MKAIALALLLALASCGQQQEEPSAVAVTVAVVDSLSLPVYGMTCDGCVQAVCNSLEKVEGVGSVEVDLEEGVALVRRSDPEKADLGNLRAAVLRAGYATEPEGD